VVGYTAASGHLDGAAVLLFLILVFWQMPHFYAIAMYRLDDYASAKLPVLPVKKGIRRTKYEMLAYIIGFIVVSLALAVYGYAGYFYEIVVGVLGLGWLWKWSNGLKAESDAKWARGMFKYSLIVLMVMSVTLALNAWLP
jgi:protoheme IX farnesyltransferase